MDVAGIVSELRAVQKGIEETILLLERSQPFSARIENRRAQTSPAPAARSRTAGCRRVGSDA
jgi:hypothetical protein